MKEIYQNRRSLVWRIVAAVVAPFLVTSAYLLVTRWHTWHFTAPIADYAGLAFSILVGAGFIASLPIQMSRRIISLLIYVPVSAIAIYIFSAAFLFLWYGWVPVPRTPGPHDYSEQDVQSFITPGRPLAEITNRFGQPTFLRTNGEYLVWHFRSGLPETYPAKTVTIAGEPGYSFAGFTLWTTNGQAARWGASDWKK